MKTTYNPKMIIILKKQGFEPPSSIGSSLFDEMMNDHEKKALNWGGRLKMSSMGLGYPNKGKYQVNVTSMIDVNEGKKLCLVRTPASSRNTICNMSLRHKGTTQWLDTSKGYEGNPMLNFGLGLVTHTKKKWLDFIHVHLLSVCTEDIIKLRNELISEKGTYATRCRMLIQV